MIARNIRAVVLSAYCRREGNLALANGGCLMKQCRSRRFNLLTLHIALKGLLFLHLKFRKLSTHFNRCHTLQTENRLFFISAGVDDFNNNNSSSGKIHVPVVYGTVFQKAEFICQWVKLCSVRRKYSWERYN